MPGMKRSYPSKYGKYSKKRRTMSTFRQNKYKMDKPITPGMKRETHKYTRYASQGGNRIEIVLADVATNTEKNFQRFFDLGELQNFSDFQNLYDQYRIRYVKIICTPLSLQIQQGTTVNPPTAQPMLQMAACIDYDDDGLLDWAGITQYGNCRLYNYNEVYQNPKRFTWFFTSMCRVSVGEDGSFQGGSPKAWQWIDISNPRIEHYGFKVVLRNQGGGQFEDSQVGCGYAFTVKYYLEFRNTR